MPLYEFQCFDCKVVVEMMMKITDPTPNHCASCGLGPMTKMMSKSNFSVKEKIGSRKNFAKQIYSSPIDDIPTIEEAEKAIP